LYRNPAPERIIDELFGVDVVETCDLSTEVDPRPWIGKFVETFEKAERGTDVVRSVTLLHLRFRTVSTLQHTEALGQPRRTDVSMPHNEFFVNWLCSVCRQHAPLRPSNINQCELFVFENAKAAKKLEVLVWTVVTVKIDHGHEPALHYIFRLQVVDM
ncbi:hypothetical protein AAVH_30605, partial [Aphelenchoides avenae]